MLAWPHGVGRCGVVEPCHNISLFALPESVVVELLLPYDWNADRGNGISAGDARATHGATWRVTYTGGDPPP
jgi:hypothetical protein